MKKISLFFPILLFNFTYAAGLDEDFYKQFWQINPNATIEDMVLEPNYNTSFSEIVFKANTGYGTKEDRNDSSESAYQNLINKFNACFRNGSCSNTQKRIKDLKFAIASIEQCYANVPVAPESESSQSGSEKSSGLSSNGVQRTQTKIEQESELICTPMIAANLMNSYAALTNGDFSYNILNIEPDTDKIKKNLQNLHNILISKLQETKQNFIMEANKSYGSSKVADRSFIDKSQMEDNEVNDILNAYDNIITINSYLPPITVLPLKKTAEDDDVKILLYGKVVNLSDYDASKKQAEQIANSRNSQIKSLESMMKKQKKLIESFGTLKQNAILSISSLVAERTKKDGTSMLHSIEKKINEQLQASQDKEVKPSKILLQVRDAINLNNKLSYMTYIALERMQQALSVTQIAQLKPLSDRINDITDKINKLAYEFDLGSKMSEPNSDNS